MSGEMVRLSDYLGRPVILNFWATWCAPCRLEMPELQRAQAEFGDEGPVVLTINQEESAERVAEFLDEVGLTLPALLDSDAEVGKMYGAFFLPTTVIVDQDGRVAAIHRGMISRDELDEYLGRPAPAEGS
jgi:thiol-disulfide isomerase/thioredoxin